MELVSEEINLIFIPFVFFQVLPQLLQWLEVSGKFNGHLSHPVKISSFLHNNSFFTNVSVQSRFSNTAHF